MYITRMLWDVACHAVGMKHESEFPVLLVMQEHLQIVQDFVWKRKKHEGGDKIRCTLWASSAVTKKISFIWQLRIISWSLIQCNKEATVSAFFFTDAQQTIIFVVHSNHFQLWLFHSKCSSDWRRTMGLLWWRVYFVLAKGVKSYGLGLVAANGGGGVFFQYLLWANKQEWYWVNPIIIYKLPQ